MKPQLNSKSENPRLQSREGTGTEMKRVGDSTQGGDNTYGTPDNYKGKGLHRNTDLKT